MQSWLATTVPHTVLGAQVDAKIFPDPFYGMNLRLEFLSTPDALAFLVFAMLLGLLGTYMSVSKHLSEIQPQ